MTINIGDKIRIKEISEYAYQNEKIGNGIVKEISNPGLITELGGHTDITFKNGYSNWYPIEDLVIVRKAEEQITTFKVGDRVRCSGHKDTGTIIDIGITIYLMEHDKWSEGHDGNDLYYSRPEGLKGAKDRCWWENVEWLEKITTSEETKEQPLTTDSECVESLLREKLRAFFDRHSLSSPTSKKPMSKLTALQNKMLDADTKALMKAGFLDSELDLTEEGENALFSILILANKTELAKEARKAIREQKGKEEEEV